jgi:hypothetical protein
MTRNVVPKGRQIISPGRKSWVVTQRCPNARPKDERQVGIPAQFPVKKIGCPSLPAFFWREAGDFDFPFHSHQQSNSPPLRLRSGQTLSRKNRETRTGHPSPVRTFKYGRRPRTLSLRSMVPTLSQRSRKDGAPSIYFTNGKVGHSPVN